MRCDPRCQPHFNRPPLHLSPVEAKAVDLDVDGGRLPSDGGLVLLTDPDDPLGFRRDLAAVLRDPRDPRRVDLTLHDLADPEVMQWIEAQTICYCA